MVSIVAPGVFMSSSNSATESGKSRRYSSGGIGRTISSWLPGRLSISAATSRSAPSASEETAVRAICPDRTRSGSAASNSLMYSTALAISVTSPGWPAVMSRWPVIPIRSRRATVPLSFGGSSPVAVFVTVRRAALLGADVVVVFLDDVHGRLLRGGAAAVDPDVGGDEVFLLVRVGALVLGDQPAGPGVGAVVEEQAVYVLVPRVVVLVVFVVLVLVIFVVVVFEGEGGVG